MEPSARHGAPLRMTPSRRAILERVRHSASHPTADEVYREVRKALPRVSLGTVYRNLEILVRRGLIRIVDDAGGRRRYDRTLEDHCHAQCRSCGRIEDVRVDAWPRLERLLEGECDFEIDGCRVNFVGICPECAHGPTDPVARKGRIER